MRKAMSMADVKKIESKIKKYFKQMEAFALDSATMFRDEQNPYDEAPMLKPQEVFEQAIELALEESPDINAVWKQK